MLAVSRRTRNKFVAAAREYAALGWHTSAGASAPEDGDRACSCDRVGCPAPGAHPTSAAWAIQATLDPDVLAHWWSRDPEANVILPTGRVFDVFDVPAELGAQALAAMLAAGAPLGPVAAIGAERYLFFVATRNGYDEDEWWSCHLDCSPETIADTPGTRWHCRDSYVVAPPSVLPSGREVTWIRQPGDEPLPDPLRLLEFLAD